MYVRHLDMCTKTRLARDIKECFDWHERGVKTTLTFKKIDQGVYVETHKTNKCADIWIKRTI
jgi:hypothetical protein